MSKITSKKTFELGISIDKNLLQIQHWKDQKTKRQENRVYLKNGQEFQIFLKNYRGIPIMVELTINGKTEKEAIILEPKERLFLERYLSNNFKFKFNTYELPISSQKLIKNKIELATIIAKIYIAENVYIEKNTAIIRPVLAPQTLDYPDDYIYTYNNTKFKNNSTSNIFLIDYCTQEDLELLNNNYSISELLQSTSSSNNKEVLNSIEYSDQKLVKEKFQNIKEKIGIIERGGYSDQKFEECPDFRKGKLLDQYTIYIYPISAQIHEKVSEKINGAVYCSVCGRKQKYGQKYCPADGTKFDYQ